MECSLRSVHTKRHVAATLREDKSLGVYMSGDKLLQQVACHIAATNRFVCTGKFMSKALSQQQNFVAATSRTNSV